MKDVRPDPELPIRAIGYGRVSTEEQADSRAGLDAQRTAIETEVAHRGWSLIEYVEDRGYSGKDLVRPGIQCVLDHLKARHADVLVVAKLDRLARSMHDFSDLLERRSAKEGWSIVLLDVGVDTTTSVGELVANHMAGVSRFERRRMGERTKEALAAKKAQGVTLGRPSYLPQAVVDRVVASRQAGETFQSIADGLNADRVPTSQGGKEWYPATVRAVLRRAERGS